ncbi:MAG: cytochrome c [Xanthomonadales bacterium]|nr:cytochrome c [Xanthomonadales bacterium]
MSKINRKTLLLTVLVLLLGCASPNPLENYEELEPATVLAHPEAMPSEEYPPEVVAHGQYLVKILRCGACHTDGALAGRPNPARLMAGSSVGIAFTNPLDDARPGIIYPSNLTPDPETGIGGWSEREIIQMVRTGDNRHGGKALSVMPYLAYADLNDEDVRAIAAYLRSLPPVRHEVPANVPEGRRARAPYVHFGVYMSKDLVIDP